MKIINSIYRKIVYPLIFITNKLDVKNIIALLNELDSNYYKDVQELQLNKLRILLNTAISKSTYYKSVFSNVKEEIINFDNIKTLPQLKKETLRDLDKHVLVTDVENCTIKRMTAGTTGTPLSIYLNEHVLSWQLATRYLLFSWHGINIGDREARFWGRPLKGFSYKAKDLLLNRKRFCFAGNSKEDMLEEYRQLLKYKPDYFYGYSSLILNSAILCEEEGLEVPKLKAIICTAETLSEFQRRYISKIFKCKVIVEYGCTESDIIAFECSHGSLHVMSHNVYIEKDKDTNEIIYTDLNNTLTPLIRYNLGDNISLDQKICECKRNLPVIKSIEGRTVDQIVNLDDGTSFHAVKFAYLIEEISSSGVNIKQFKIVFSDNKLTFFVNLDSNREYFEQEMKKGLETILENKIDYSFKYGFIEKEAHKKYSYFEIT